MKFQKQATEIHYFFYSQAFADGLRASFAILSPALAGSYFGFFETGLTISLGAMCVSLTDAPGPLIHRRNGMLFCSLFIFIMALVTAFARMHPVTMILEIASAGFFFSMFNVYGNRAASVGNAALLLMILSMDTPVSPSYALTRALLILGGGIYYLIFSLLLHTIRPYRIAQRMLGEYIREIVTYLTIKADFYDVNSDIDSDYRRLVAQQIVVNEKQDAVRELFFKTRKIVEESTNIGRRLIFTFIETVDLFEDITASYYDYNLLRQQFGQSGALDLIHASLKKISYELDRVGIAIQTNTGFIPSFDYDRELQDLRAQMDVIAQKERTRTLVLRKLMVNVRKLLKDLKNVVIYFNTRVDKKPTLDHRMFVNHQSLDPKIMADNLTFKSSIFRHSLRVCIACVAGFIVARLLGYGHHSYWILLTIAFIIKPAFSLTKQRNVERIIGTLAGGAIGILILVFIPDKTIHFILMVLFMIATYSFMRIRYLVMVICTTPYVLILFSFLGSEFKPVVEERIFDTVLGCAIAFSASYFLFPKWESDDLKIYMSDMVRSNANYLQKITEALSGYQVDTLAYKLARKEVYLSSANLSAAFQRMLSEPKSKQRGEKELQQFVVLNYILISNIAMLTTTLLSKEVRTYPEDVVNTARRSLNVLNEIQKKFGEENGIQVPALKTSFREEKATTNDDILLKEQLSFIHRLCADIDKTVAAFT